MFTIVYNGGQAIRVPQDAMIQQVPNNSKMMKKILLLSIVIGILSFWQRPKEWADLRFEHINIQNPPEHTGALSQNNLLGNAKQLFVGELDGPESAVVEGDTIYTTVKEAVVKIVNNKIEKRFKCPNSHPLGIRRLNKELLVIADGIRGLVSLNPNTGEFKILVPSEIVYEGKPISFVDDVDVINENEVIFTDASWLYRMDNFVTAAVSGLASGRVYHYNIKTGELHLLMDHLHFSNGIQLFPDKESFIVSETMTAKIWRYYLSGEKQGKKELFATNLPGNPDNIRISHDGKSFFVALCISRLPGEFNSIDFVMSSPNLRWFLFNIIPHKLHQFLMMEHTESDYGLAAELDLNGKIIRTFHAPEGKINHLSQITDDGKNLYVSSFMNPFLAVMPR
ncbi:hypothetical protein FO519_000978 [Halicephalobus sp. NKZ332]|nr:hypothetical protein FO519_000978 [Halicephalobus sp. NKZ332]